MLYNSISGEIQTVTARRFSLQPRGVSSTHEYGGSPLPNCRCAKRLRFDRPSWFLYPRTDEKFNNRTRCTLTEKLSTRDRVYHRRTPGTAPGAKSLTAPVPFVRFLAPRNENTYFAIKTAPANTRASAIALRT